MKKLLAAFAASAMILSLAGVSAFAEGLADDGDLIDDEPIEDIEEIIEPEPEPIIETEPEIVETTVTEAPVVTEAVEPVQPAPSPTTGNAPVALAVIPVALAAAAVIAKKSK